VSKRSPGSKWAMKQEKERYRKERERYRAKLLRRRAAEQSALDEQATSVVD